MPRRFSGIAAHTGIETGDGCQILTLTHRDLPLPVTMLTRTPLYEFDTARVVGLIDEVVQQGDDQLVAGNITEQWAIDLLEDESEAPWFLQAEVDAATTTEPPPYKGGPMILESARLAAVHLGHRPAWPDTQIRLARFEQNGDF